MLKPEEINGKMYQPVVCLHSQSIHCVKDCAIKMGGKICELTPCRAKDRPDGLDVYYTTIKCFTDELHRDRWGLYRKGEEIKVNGKRAGFVKFRENIESGHRG